MIPRRIDPILLRPSLPETAIGCQKARPRLTGWGREYALAVAADATGSTRPKLARHCVETPTLKLTLGPGLVGHSGMLTRGLAR